MFNHKVSFDNKDMYLENAISLYIKSLFRTLKTNNLKELIFIDYEF